jgi:hypothetical protein
MGEFSGINENWSLFQMNGGTEENPSYQIGSPLI